MLLYTFPSQKFEVSCPGALREFAHPLRRVSQKSTYLVFQVLQLQALRVLPLGPAVSLRRRGRGRRPPLNVALRVPCDGDAEVVSVFLSYQPDQVYRMSQPALRRLPAAQTWTTESEAVRRQRQWRRRYRVFRSRTPVVCQFIHPPETTFHQVQGADREAVARRNEVGGWLLQYCVKASLSAFRTSTLHPVEGRSWWGWVDEHDSIDIGRLQ